MPPTFRNEFNPAPYAVPGFLGAVRESHRERVSWTILFLELQREALARRTAPAYPYLNRVARKQGLAVPDDAVLARPQEEVRRESDVQEHGTPLPRVDARARLELFEGYSAESNIGLSQHVRMPLYSISKGRAT